MHCCWWTCIYIYAVLSWADAVIVLTDIPFFKQVVIMVTVCDVCGKRDSEVKSGSGIEPMATRITLRLTDIADLSRDILKVSTDYCS